MYGHKIEREHRTRQAWCKLIIAMLVVGGLALLASCFADAIAFAPAMMGAAAKANVRRSMPRNLSKSQKKEWNIEEDKRLKAVADEARKVAAAEAKAQHDDNAAPDDADEDGDHDEGAPATTEEHLEQNRAATPPPADDEPDDDDAVDNEFDERADAVEDDEEVTDEDVAAEVAASKVEALPPRLHLRRKKVARLNGIARSGVDMTDEQKAEFDWLHDNQSNAEVDADEFLQRAATLRAQWLEE